MNYSTGEKNRLKIRDNVCDAVKDVLPKGNGISDFYEPILVLENRTLCFLQALMLFQQKWLTLGFISCGVISLARNACLNNDVLFQRFNVLFSRRPILHRLVEERRISDFSQIRFLRRSRKILSFLQIIILLFLQKYLAADLTSRWHVNY